jgi:Ca2+-binding EF-hand superfamily protein
MHKNKFVASSVYQKNVVDHMEELELELCEELSEEEMMMVRGGRIKLREWSKEELLEMFDLDGDGVISEEESYGGVYVRR